MRINKLFGLSISYEREGKSKGVVHRAEGDDEKSMSSDSINQALVAHSSHAMM